MIKVKTGSPFPVLGKFTVMRFCFGLFILPFISCSNGSTDPGSSSNITSSITMTTEETSIQISLLGSGQVVIDWGDESPIQTVTLSSDSFTTYKYTTIMAGPKTIHIKGKSIIGLVCFDNNLTSLDVSKSPVLTYLECWRNNLTSLDVSKNPVLTDLYCTENSLTSLDVSKNPVLEYLSCNVNSLTSLDVSKNPVLEHLTCNINSLTSLDVSKNSLLEWLGCTYNNLTSIIVSNNGELTYIECSDNKLEKGAFNALFGMLPDCTALPFGGRIYCPNNPGFDKADKSIATVKNWTLYYD